jgi:hypothetical protein
VTTPRALNPITARCAAVLAFQVGWILITYWARVQTFIVQRGRFHNIEPMLRSDLLVFVAPFVAATIVIGHTLGRRFSRRTLGYFIALVLAVVSEFIALLIALNAVAV